MSMGLVPHVAENINGSDQMTSLFDRELVKNRTIYISGPIDSATALLAVAKLYYLSDISDDPITIIFVDCPGGSVTAGWAIYDAIQNVACEVSTVCMGMCASMGAFLLASGTKGKRIVTPNSEVMIHQPSAGTQGMVTDMEINIEHFQRVKRRINATAGYLPLLRISKTPTQPRSITTPSLRRRKSPSGIWWKSSPTRASAV